MPTTDYPHPAVTVDLVLMTVHDGALCVLLQRREAEPFAGCWVVPGSFVRIDEPLDAAAQRTLADKAGLASAWLEQLYTFGEPGRDPRERVITVAYFALLPEADLAAAVAGRADLALAPIAVAWTGEEGGPVAALGPGGTPLTLGFDHARILGLAVQRLRGKLGWAPVALALVGEHFTLRELQAVNEAILGRALNKPAFRKRMVDSGWIEATGEKESRGAFRPAELYRAAQSSN